ncbi:MAG: FAD-dependent oxidoreductase [Anaerolineales bacterium]|nr:FAD-dependent oxidoreductase [Anaerolineales bacterium]
MLSNPSFDPSTQRAAKRVEPSGQRFAQDEYIENKRVNMKTTYDIAVIGAGVVGSAIARELSRYQLKVALIEENPDVGMGTSKASTAIWHTGFDAKPGTLEATLMRRSYILMDKYMPEANIPHERLGAILIAWNQEQLDALPALENKAHDNGVTDVKIISVDEVYRREPNINKGALGGLLVPGEGILCTFTVPLAYATQAVLNGVELFLNHSVRSVKREDDIWILDNEISAKYIVNAAGLFSDEINAHFGRTNFTVTPRRGQLIVYDKLARPLVNHVLLPVPTSKTKGVLISPTVYGNILLGPTAEDLPASRKTATQTTADGFELLLGKGREILPQLLDEEVTATYSGLRAATEHSDYQIEMYTEQRYLCVGGIRSTGISSAMGIAEYALELLKDAGLQLKLKDEFIPVRMPNIGEAFERPYQNANMVAKNPQYAEMVCHCERVSRGELMDAMNSVIPATNLDGLRRRTRASQGRCQGFNCHAALVKTLENRSNDFSRFTSKATEVATTSSYDALIVGAGPAGLAAAIELKKLGIKDVLVVDREPEAGGMPRFCQHTGFGRADLWRMYTGPHYARYYRELAEKHGVEIHTSTTITGWNEGKLTFTSPGGLGEIEAQAVLLATGIRERPRAARMIPGTRPQGIYTTGSLQRFVYQEGLPVGKRAVIVGAELVSLSALMTLQHAGVKCAMMITEESAHQIEFPYVVMKWALADILTRTPLVTNARVTNIFGHKRLEGIEITRGNNQTEVVECDSVIFTGNWISENEMARLGGLEIDSVTKAPKINAGFHSSVEGVFVAGNLLRGGKSVNTADQCALEGSQAGKAIAKFLR